MRGSRLNVGLPLVSLLSLAAAACGPAEAPKPPAPVAAKPSAEPKKAAIPEDRAPAEAPAGLVLQGHLKGLKTATKGIKAWLPPNAEIEPRALVTELTSSALERIVDIDKPADFVVQVREKGDKDPGMAVAFGVEDGLDLESAVKETHKIEVLPGGVRRLVPNNGSKPRCVVAPAIGAAKYRLVCGRPGDDPLPLTPWLARGVTRKEEPASTARLELDIATVKKLYGNEIEKARAFARGDLASEVKTGYAELDRSLKTIVKALADEMFDALEDLDALTLDAAVPADGVQLSLTTAFSGTKSWFARAMLAGGDLPPGAPRLAKLPGDGGWLGFFSRGNPQNDALVAPIQTAARDLVVALATDFKWPAKDRDLALDVVKLAFPASADTSSVSGHQGHVTWPEGSPKPYGDFARAAANAMLAKTWSVTVAERDPKGAIALAKAFYELAARPSFGATYRALTHDMLSIKVTSKPLAIKDLPKGSFAQRAEVEMLQSAEPKGVVEEKPAKGKAKPAPKPKGKDTPLVKLVSETIIAPEGTGRTWIGHAQNLPDGELWKHLSAAMGGTGPALGARPGFDFITTGNPTSGGLVTLDGFLRTFVHGHKSEDLLGKLPDQGKGAFEWRVNPSKPPKSNAELAVLLPRDIVAAIYLAATR